jgi:predicted ATPase/class 3 adenylate cyclase
MPFFLFTDIEGSTKLWENFPQVMPAVIRRHDTIIKEALARYGGRIIDHMGDGVYAVFEGECQPLLCTLKIQIRFAQEGWGEIGSLRVRMGLNARTAEQAGIDYFKERNDYFGPVVNHTSRLMNVAWGGQILFTGEVLAQDQLPVGARVVDLGSHILRNLPQPQQIYSLEHPQMLRRNFPPLRTLSARANNLPSPTTIFIGREQELAEIGRLLADPQCRLLTLTGPGGIGKTRLSLAAATRQLDEAGEDDRFANGIYFIPLAPLAAVEHIAPAIADALQFSFYENSPPEKQLLDYLHHKKMLLILDNFEHLVQGSELLSTLLAGAPGLTILVTSRERLNLQSEWTLSVLGMEYPATDTAALREDVESYTAVQLFLNSARRVNPSFITNEDEQRVIAHICRLLDGLPLGIELAATWTRVLSCQEIAGEIRKSLDFLSSNLRDRPERHQSLSAVFNHSWQLLQANEQVVLKKLCVFCGDFSQQAGQMVAGATLPHLIALMDKSMLRRNGSGRYEIHSTIRQYLVQKLAEDKAEHEAASTAHSVYFANFAAQQRSRLRGPAQKSALYEMAREIENIRAGWQTALTLRLEGTIETYMDSLYHFYWIRGWTREGADTFRDAVSALTGLVGGPVGGTTADKGTAVLLGRIMARQGAFNYRLGLADKAGRLLQESLNIFQKYNLVSEMGYVFTYLGATAYLQGDNDAAEQLLQQGLQYAQTTRSQLGATIAYHHLGLVAQARHDYDEARQCHQKSLDLSETLGEPFGMAVALNHLGIVAYNLGQYEDARDLQRRSLALRREINDQWGIATTLNSLALVAYSQGKHEQARQFLLESLNLYREVGDKRSTAVTLKDLSVVALAQERPEEAAQLNKESQETFPNSGMQANVTTISSMG